MVYKFLKRVRLKIFNSYVVYIDYIFGFLYIYYGRYEYMLNII